MVTLRSLSFALFSRFPRFGKFSGTIPEETRFAIEARPLTTFSIHRREISRSSIMRFQIDTFTSTAGGDTFKINWPS